MDYAIEKIASVERIGNFENEYVYDVGMENEHRPFLFANDILIHNSVYFSCVGALDKKSAVDIADNVAHEVNDSFKEFTHTAFLCNDKFDNFLRVDREIVGDAGIFQTKKKYVIHIVDKDGASVDELKTMGSEIKKSDTPKIIQLFLAEVVTKLMSHCSENEVASFINTKRKEIIRADNYEKLGISKRVNNIEKFQPEYDAPGTLFSQNGNKLTVPGHVRASCNYNKMISQFDDDTKPIQSGDKVLIYYVDENNEFSFSTMAFPAEIVTFPEWFNLHFKIDESKTMDALIDKKLSGIFSAVGQCVPTFQTEIENDIFKF